MADEQKQFKLFREKSLEAVESPESLNDYLKVTSPGVWLVLGAVIALLIGVVLWSIFGRIESRLDVAVISDSGECVCLVPYDDLKKVLGSGTVTIDGVSYDLQPELNIQTEVLPETTNPYVLVAGNLAVGDVVVEVPVDAELDSSIASGSVVIERLQPISLLLQ